MKHPVISMSPVTGSSQIEAMGHDSASNTLAVKFATGATYHYHNVDAKAFAAFNGAKSKGSHFHQHIRGCDKHPHTMICAPKGKK